MKKFLLPLLAALTLCQSASAQRPWTEALALVSPDQVSVAQSEQAVPPCCAVLPASPDAAQNEQAAQGAAVSPDALQAASADQPAPLSPDQAALSPDVSGDVSADTLPEEEPVVLETLKGSFFTVEVPQDQWKLEERTPGSAALYAQDKSCMISITVLSAKRTTLREAAEQLASQYSEGIKTLKRLDDPDGTGDAWEFRPLISNKPGYAQVFELDGGRIGVITIVGDPDAPDVVDIFNSITFD